MSASALLQPLKVGSTTIANRIGMSALTRNRSSATVPNDVMLEYYIQRAQGGAGLIVTEGTLVTPQGTEWQDAPGIWNDAQIAGWKKITDAVHAEGSKIYTQLWHLGRVSHPDAPQQIAAGVPVYAPSAIAARGGKFRFLPGEPGYVTPTEVADPSTLIALFKKAAENAKKAGFDGVELHGANGYLVHQFLDSSSNKRTDSWGGSVENRTRFALETLKALKEVYGPDVAIKLSPIGGYNDMGMPIDETLATYTHLLREIDNLGLAYVALMQYHPYMDPVIDGTPRGTKHDVFPTYAPILKNTLLFGNANITPEAAEALVADEKNGVAGVFFGSGWISHPDVAKRIEKGKPLDNQLDFTTLYGAPGVDPHLGYTDYKAAEL